MRNLKFKLLLLVLSAMVTGTSFRFRAEPKIYAVIVGVSRYSDPNIIGLKYAHRDAEAYRNFLETPKGGSVPESNIVLLTNERATRGAIIKGLREMFNKATEEDVVIFYFSGHGVPDPKISTDLYLTTHDTDDENYTGTALLKEDVARQFTQSKAKLKLFFADACHSGGSGIYLGTKDDASATVNKLIGSIAAINEPSWAAITASSMSEKSFEDVKWGGGHGVFTYHLIKGMEGEADKTPRLNAKAKGNGDGLVTVRELYDYLSNVIPAETNDKQHPDKQGNNEDIFPVSAVNTDKLNAAVTKYKKPAGGTAQQANNNLINKDEVRTYDTETKDLPSRLCIDGSYANGDYIFVNNYGETILLTSYWTTSGQTVNALIGPGEKATVSKIYVSGIWNQKLERSTKSYTFYFRTVDESKPILYGTKELVVEACKVKTEVLTKTNLYLAVDGRKG